MVPDRLWASERIQATDVRLWCALSFLARGRGYCEATDATLAAKIRLSEQTVRRSLLRLEECRFIERSRQGEGRIITLRPDGDGEPVPELAFRVIG